MSPDLILSIESPALTPDRARAIARADWPAGALWVSAIVPGWWSKVIKSGEQPSSIQMGAHDILAEEADWDAPTWLFDPSQLPRFVATLRRLFELLPEEFTMLAAWGDPARREEQVERDELLRIVASNNLGNAVLYRVTGVRRD